MDVDKFKLITALNLFVEAQDSIRSGLALAAEVMSWDNQVDKNCWDSVARAATTGTNNLVELTYGALWEEE